MAQQPGPPSTESVVIPENLKPGERFRKLIMHHEWLKYLFYIEGEVAKAPSRRTVVPLSSQGASIGVTPIPAQDMPPGLYRVSYYFQIRQPGAVSSSLQVTFNWTNLGIALGASGAAEAGNTTATKQFGTLVVRIDPGTPISYSTTYASAGAPAMTYDLDITLESLALGV